MSTIPKSSHSTLVMKFGGTSVGTPEAMAQAAQIVLSAHPDWPRLVVVSSALAGVTNLLLRSATRAAEGDSETYTQAVDELRERHFNIIDKLVTEEARQQQTKQEIVGLIENFRSLCQAIAVLGEASPRALDAVAALGERMSVRLFSAAIESAGLMAPFVEATRLIITDSFFQSAHPDMDVTTENIRCILNPMLDQGQVPIVTGFISSTPGGVTTTLGRGGSDYSAALLGAALPADEVWIWTDVDGVMSADPRLISTARTIPLLSFREVSELAYFGAKVLHPKTIRPVIEANIGLRVANTFNPSHPGTRVVADPNTFDSRIFKAVTAVRGLQLVTVEGRGMMGVPGVAARTFGAVAATGTSVPMITQASSEQSICFAVPVDSTEKVVASLESVFSNEISRRDIDRVWATDEVVIISVVGVGMSITPGIAGQVFGALGKQKLNVIAIAQGSSEVSISLVVSVSESQAALSAIHALIE